jgi:hypothetical protein
VDAEQIRREMRATRASIDRKLDVLADRTAEVRQDAVRRGAAAAAMAATALVGVWWWRAAQERRRHRHDWLKGEVTGVAS